MIEVIFTRYLWSSFIQPTLAVVRQSESLSNQGEVRQSELDNKSGSATSLLLQEMATAFSHDFIFSLFLYSLLYNVCVLG